MDKVLEERVNDINTKKVKNEGKFDKDLSLKEIGIRFVIGTGIWYGICYSVNYIYNHPEIYKPIIDFIKR
ncbi:MAG: hypothetical protein ABIH79_01585 [archaeon]